MTATQTHQLDLQEVSEETFDSIVNQDVRGTLDDNTSSQLRAKENIDRWHDMLLTLKRRVEVQLAANRGEQAEKQAEFLRMGPAGKQQWLLFKGTNEKWRQGAIRFKNGVEDKLAEAKRLRAQLRGDSYFEQVVRTRDRAMNEMMELRSAIMKHREDTINEIGDQDEIDSLLWHFTTRTP